MKIPTTGRMVILEDYQNNIAKDIRMRLRFKTEVNRFFYFPKVQAQIKMKTVNLPQDIKDLPYRERMIISGDVPFEVLILKGDYIKISCQQNIPALKENERLIINCKGFGLWEKYYVHEENHNMTKGKGNSLKEEQYIAILQSLGEPYISPWSDYLRLEDKLRKKSSKISFILTKWKMEGKIPLNSVKIIRKLKEAIDNG